MPAKKRSKEEAAAIRVFARIGGRSKSDAKTKANRKNATQPRPNAQGVPKPRKKKKPAAKRREDSAHWNKPGPY